MRGRVLRRRGTERSIRRWTPWSSLWLLCAIVLALACRTSPSARPGARGDDDFPDHTVAEIPDLETFRTLAAGGKAGTEVLKFVITEFSSDKRRRIRYLDSTFYELHDEWYWFRLLNGAPVPGSSARPTTHTFASPDDAAAWAKTQTTLPLNLRMVEDERLYSDRFYELAMDEAPRTFGVGSLVHLPAQTLPKPRDEIWAFELQYRDPATEHELGIFFDALESSLPPEIADSLVWIVRSPEQARVARRLRERDRPLAPRVVDYAELALPGELEVYSTGLVAGRLRTFAPEDARLAETHPTDILLLESIPDFLPPAAGVITTVPQTPLAHVAILARNRGIPNAYLGGVLSDPNLQQLARVHAPVIVRATENDLQIHPIDEADYRRWLGLRERPTHRVPGVDLRRAPYTVDLSKHDARDADELRPLIGGKATGFSFLMSTPGIDPPDHPLALSIRAYAEHLRPLERTIRDLLADREFQSSSKVRLLVLEGEKGLTKRFPDAAAFAREFGADQKHASVLRDVVARGGLRRMIRDRPMDPRTLAHFQNTLRHHFRDFAATQGLRFRSSSTAEDIEGFTGAGLYVSSTGFLSPERQATKKDRKHTIEWAIKRTWASYWSAEAFEERRLAGIDHMSGNMGVLVHARFDDPLERANGVATFTRLPPGHEPIEILEINVQAGALSVANPPTDTERRIQPERLQLRRRRDGGRVTVARIGASTEVRTGESVLDDEEALALFEQCAAIARTWLDVEGRPSRTRAPESAPRGVALDLEFRVMRPGWPARSDGKTTPARLVLKQVRSLEPGLPADPAVRRLPIPREVLARASAIERKSCRANAFAVELLEVFTDPLLSPDLGHATHPFVAAVELRGLDRLPRLRGAPSPLRLTHLDLAAVEHRGAAGGPAPHVRLRLNADAAAAAGFDTIELDSGGRASLVRGKTPLIVEPAQCASKSELTTPDAFLLELLRR
jgi:hypothetical protein